MILIIVLAGFLRLYKLGSIPPSLYWDEASLGYNAYSILKTARDEYGKFLPLTNFAAFGDYKPPGYIYMTVPSIAVFGLNEFAIRFPSAFFGVLTVLLTYFLTKKLLEDSSLITHHSSLKNVALLAAFFLAISPWHIQFSRGAFEANLGLFFSVLGIWLFLKFAKDNPLWILPSALSLLAGMYTFTGQRLFVPFILIVLAIQFRKRIFQHLNFVAVTAVIAGFLFWPLLVFTTQTIEGRLRFDEVTIFKDLQPINESIKYRESDNFSWWADLVHNRRLFYGYQYLIHYFDAFNPNFLFTRGDVNPRLSIGEVGELYYLDLLFILAGIYFLFAAKLKYRFLIIAWLIVSPLGPAMARETPHALRMIHILPTFQILSAIGLYHLYQIVRYKKLFITFTFLLLTFNFLYYLHMYWVHWPLNYSGAWQYGYKQAVERIKPLYDQADQVVVTKSLGRPYIYFLLYMRFDPQDYRESAQIIKDRFFFINVEGFDKFKFVDNPSAVPSNGKTLYVVSPGQLPAGSQKLLTINDLGNLPVFDIGEGSI
ncbi:hypothetical protein A2165_01935 [Candidatus Curtissbacteria bacterium RBG_13_40_7]|uniref:ArnT-like N-terminal domain-containing protein n=1 Tax=Candidatus Curtissbacteria bacterium RBG_13_40_7 TaxID=1797706 RepID=A0A1F5FU40_9BACT|nr:MAG: hypothetical protein A2165_01935 [Candidatus Curtissbacteria bacterium RBG_13_40_7]